MLPPVAASAEGDPLVMGVFPRRNVKTTLRMFQPLAEYLSRRLGRRVELETARDFPSFWQGVSERRYDIVHFNQYHYIEARARYGYEVILKNVEFGAPLIGGAIFVRKDSGIDAIEDLRGKTVLFGGGPQAMMSYIVPHWLLQRGGLQPGDYIEVIAKNPPNAVIATYYGQADAAGSGDIVLQLDTVTMKIDASRMKQLARSERLPHLPWAVKAGIESAVRDQLSSLLAGLGDSPEGAAILTGAELTGLMPAQDAEYDACRAIIRQALPGRASVLQTGAQE